jgi:hypothetical protein
LTRDKKVLCGDGDAKWEFEFKDDLVDTENLSTCLENYPFAEERDLECHLLTHAPMLYRITMKYQGRETLTLAGRSVECYRLEMVPDLGMLSIFGAFVPKTYFWYETAAPHKFVRYEGLESDLGTPYIVMQPASLTENK